MHKLVFYPVGNGDTSQIILENGKRILFDFRHVKNENGNGKTINLKDRLSSELKDAKKTSFDVVAFTHGDKDHLENSTEFFELLHEKQYQGNGRIKIDELWVPAAMILETATKFEQKEEFVIWRQEARYRLKQGKGIRVFSKPDKLKKWLEKENLTVESRKHLITDAGKIVPGFTLDNDGVEFFCHSPFIKHVDGEGDVLRNEASLIFNIKFKMGINHFHYMAVGDTKWEALEDIITISKNHQNEERLKWDIYNIPHHCSYLSLNDEKGKEETTPTALIEDLLLSGKDGAYIISSSKPIEDTKDSKEQQQPPHVQAKKCYVRYLKKINGTKFLVTMEEPSWLNPEPIILEIKGDGISRFVKATSAATTIVSKPASRAGRCR